MASAVPRGRVPCSRRRPRKRATRAVPTEASVSRASDDRKATFRVDIVSSWSSRLARVEGVATVVRPAERPQGGEALEQVVEGGGQPGEPGPLAVGVPGRLEAEEDHEQGDDRHRHREDDRAEPVADDDAGQEDDRGQGRQDEGGQVPGEVAVEGVDALGGRRGQLAGPLTGQPRRAEGHGPGEQLAAQGGGDPGRGAVGRNLAGPGRCRPAAAKAAARASSAGTVRASPACPIRTSWTIAAEQGGLGHQCRRADQPDGHGGHQVVAGGPGPVEQAGVDRAAVLGSRVAQGALPLGCRSPPSATAPADGTVSRGHRRTTPSPTASMGSPGRRTRARKTQ